MPRKKPLHLVSELTRHGKRVYYVRVGHEPRIRLTAPYDTTEFWQEYNAALVGAPKPVVRSPRDQQGTIAHLIAAYTTSGEWKALGASTRANRSVTYRQIEKTLADKPVTAFGKKTILASRDARKASPHAANGFVTAMRALFAWAADHEKMPKGMSDPTAGIKPLKGANAKLGHHIWTDGEVDRFRAKWPLGTRQRVAFDVLLYTGLRRSDAVMLGRQHVRTLPDGSQEFTFRTGKTGMVVTAPVLPALARTLAAGPTGDLAFVIKLDGQPYDATSFAFWFRQACKEAGVPGRAHGLRKAAASKAAEEGATESQLNALFGWADGSREAAVYTRGANRAKMAQEARQKLMEKSRTNPPEIPHLKIN